MARSRTGNESASGRARLRRKARSAPDPRAAQAFPQPGALPAGTSDAPSSPDTRGTVFEVPTSQRGDGPAERGSGERKPRATHTRSNSRPSRELAARGLRDALSQYGIDDREIERARRLPDTLREVGEHAMHAVRSWAEPRERELRRRRRARRRTLRWGTASGITAAGTAGLVILAAPAWAVIIVGGGAVVMVTGAAVTTRRYLVMRRNPLPQAAFVPRKLPPVRSITREPVARLVRAEEAFHTLAAQIVRGRRLPEEDLADTVETAASSAAALHALAADVVAMEKAAEVVARGSVAPAADMSAPLRAGAARLSAGIAEYELLVAAASRILAAPESDTAPTEFDMDLLNLRDCADRLDGWAQALADLAERR
ncbi:phage shock envelope stress response protein PspM [Nocardia albiluteola]|uniref:phage shock envelope stress response protein PspM n=1 Tax=Nocardia albiluteola TaxID=2842303 RepID=UPI001FD9391A|nr:hypothetical protein [Nocardia albiluteola]